MSKQHICVKAAIHEMVTRKIPSYTETKNFDLMDFDRQNTLLRIEVDALKKQNERLLIQLAL